MAIWQYGNMEKAKKKRKRKRKDLSLGPSGERAEEPRGALLDSERAECRFDERLRCLEREASQSSENEERFEDRETRPERVRLRTVTETSAEPGRVRRGQRPTAQTDLHSRSTFELQHIPSYSLYIRITLPRCDQVSNPSLQDVTIKV